MYVIPENTSNQIVCDNMCEIVNLKCEIILFNHDISRCRHKSCDVSRNS